MRIAPRNGPLVAGEHAGAAFDAVLELEMNLAKLVHRVAVGRADVGRALVRTGAVANVGIDEDVRFRLAFALVAEAHCSEAFGDGQGFVRVHNARPPFRPNLMSSQ